MIKTLYNVIEKELSYDENKELKLQIRDDLKYFLKECKLEKENDNLITNATRAESTISEKTFNKSMNLIYEFIGLKYIMTKLSNNKFQIKHIQ